MKIAILTYGEFRTADVAVETWNVLKTKHDVDVYIHTQTTSGTNPISEYEIKKLFKNYKLWLEPIDNFRYDVEPRDIHMNFRSYRFLYKKLIESGINYDFIIVNRLDTILFIKDIDDFFKKNHSGVIYTLDDSITLDRTFIQDHFFMGSSEVILNFLKNLPTPDKLIHSHQDFGKYLLSSGFKNIKYDFLYSFHLRPNMIDFIKSIINLNDNEFSQKLSKWFVDGKHGNLETQWKHYLRHNIINQY